MACVSGGLCRRDPRFVVVQVVFHIFFISFVQQKDRNRFFFGEISGLRSVEFSTPLCFVCANSPLQIYNYFGCAQWGLTTFLILHVKIILK
jgi:hypothetical protein